jgi:hypothetical protein
MAGVVLCVFAVHAWGGEAFLIPGVEFSKLSLKKGAWCLYRVADEALGLVDSSEVYIGIPDTAMTDAGPAYWVEIQSRPMHGAPDEGQLLKLLVLERITSMGVGDSLGEYVLRLYNKSGAHPPQEEDPKGFERLSLVVPTADSSWVVTPEVAGDTPGGAFTCTLKERDAVDVKNISTGSVTLVRRARDNFKVWFCDEIPVFHLARCEIARVRETETIPPIAGIPASGTKNSKTTAELVAFGYDAKPMMPLGPQEP